MCYTAVSYHIGLLLMKKGIHAVFMCIYAYITHKYINIYIYTHTHTRARTHTHTHTEFHLHDTVPL
jgi:hypothetical protein